MMMMIQRETAKDKRKGISTMVIEVMQREVI